MTRAPIVAGNWKMHHAPNAARAWCRAMSEWLDGGPGSSAELLIAPPSVSIPAFVEASADLPLSVAAQNCHEEASGPFTGEVSAAMLAEAGCGYVIVGHSERRHVFGETDRTVARKVRAVREEGMLPILCVGETDQERSSGRTETVIEAQLRNGLSQAGDGADGRFVVAYEPVWAIGTGNVATADQAQDAHHFLRQVLVNASGAETAAAIRILYGGSVKPANAEGLVARPDVDGVLVGGASLDAGDFGAIAAAFAKG